MKLVSTSAYWLPNFYSGIMKSHSSETGAHLISDKRDPGETRFIASSELATRGQSFSFLQLSTLLLTITH